MKRKKSGVSVSVTKKMYGWTKWGGPRMGLVKEELPEWSCQVCGTQQLRDMPAYMLAMDDNRRDFIRVCSMCKYASLLLEIATFDTWPDDLQRPQDIAHAVANLMTLPAKI